MRFYTATLPALLLSCLATSVVASPVPVNTNLDVAGRFDRFSDRAGEFANQFSDDEFSDDDEEHSLEKRAMFQNTGLHLSNGAHKVHTMAHNLKTTFVPKQLVSLGHKIATPIKTNFQKIGAVQNLQAKHRSNMNDIGILKSNGMHIGGKPIKPASTMTFREKHFPTFLGGKKTVAPVTPPVNPKMEQVPGQVTDGVKISPQNKANAVLAFEKSFIPNHGGKVPNFGGNQPNPIV